MKDFPLSTLTPRVGFAALETGSICIFVPTKCQVDFHRIEYKLRANLSRYTAPVATRFNMTKSGKTNGLANTRPPRLDHLRPIEIRRYDPDHDLFGVPPTSLIRRGVFALVSISIAPP